ncbi:MAG: hypothetical protein R6U27_15275 [Desulfobacterales bacterium]
MGIWFRRVKVQVRRWAEGIKELRQRIICLGVQVKNYKRRTVCSGFLGQDLRNLTGMTARQSNLSDHQYLYQKDYLRKKIIRIFLLSKMTY